MAWRRVSEMAWFPGEAVLIRLWDTLEKIGIGLARPKQIERVARGEAEARLINAKADLRIKEEKEKFERGEIAFDTSGKLVSVKNRAELTAESSSEDIARVAFAREMTDAVRRLQNLRKVAELAQDEVETQGPSTQPPDSSDRPIDDIWINKWTKGAEEATTEEAQRLWARVLAGQSRNPGSFSLRTIEFLRTLDIGSAQLIERLLTYAAPGALGDFIMRTDKYLDAHQLGIAERLELEHLGVISGASTFIGSVNWFLDLVPQGDGTAIGAFSYRDKSLIVVKGDNLIRVTLPAYPLTKLGRELLLLQQPTLGFAPDYPISIAELVKERQGNVNLQVGDWAPGKPMSNVKNV